MLSKGAFIYKMLTVIVQDVVAAFTDPRFCRRNDLLGTAHTGGALCHLQLASLQKGIDVGGQHLYLLTGALGVIRKSELDDPVLGNKNTVVVVKAYLGTDDITADRGVFCPLHTQHLLSTMVITSATV